LQKEFQYTVCFGAENPVTPHPHPIEWGLFKMLLFAQHFENEIFLK
jgi:hypothetical protein